MAQLRREEVDPKRAILDRLRSQHEAGWKQWERGHRLLHAQFVAARSAFETQASSAEEYCAIREAYLRALRLYRRGVETYRLGLELYARALAEYGDRFLTPYALGFEEPGYWRGLVHFLEQGDFLQEVLVPMTANAFRSSPPEEPPDEDVGRGGDW